MSKPRITVAGAGNVGATAAQRIVEKNIGNVVLIDVVEGLAQGKALDLMQTAAVERFSVHVTGTCDYRDTRDSDVIVVTAGMARKPGMSRDDLLFKNAEIVSGVVTRCAEYSPNAVIIMVTNPLDVMTYLAWKKSGFETRRVFGMAGELDSSRYAHFVAEELECLASDVEALVLGGHGDDMVPVPAHTRVRGKPLSELLDKETIERINQRTRDGGAEIVRYLKTGSAFYAPSSSVVKMVRAVVEDRGEIIPASVYLNGEYGLKDVYCGVPARIGQSGVREVVEIPLEPGEQKALGESAQRVRENSEKLKL